MYVFESEPTEAYRRGHSLVVFDHWRRVQRLPYLEETLQRLRSATGAEDAFAIWGSERVTFFVVSQEKPRAARGRSSSVFRALA